LHNLGVPDVLAIPRVFRGYPTEKPAELSQILIEQSTEPGALVVAPFCGSASVRVAAGRASADVAGNDTSQQARRLRSERLTGAGAALGAPQQLRKMQENSQPGLELEELGTA